MEKGKISIFGILGILVLVVAASGCTSNNNSTNTTPSTPTATPTSTSASYQTITVGGLKCQINSSQVGGHTTRSIEKAVYASPHDNLEIEVYPSTNNLYHEAINFAAGGSGTQVATTQTVSGHQVTTYTETELNTIMYFFTVKGKPVDILQEGTSVNNHLVDSFYNLN